MILRAGRCPHTVAMELLYPGKSATEKIKAEIAQGYYFEHMLTGKRPVFREQPIHESYYRYINRAHDKTTERIEAYAAILKDMYIPDEYECGIYNEYECDELIICGETDIKWTEGDRGMIVDAKWMSNINDVLDPNGRMFIIEYMMQPPTYAMLDCIKQSNNPDSLYKAAVALMNKSPFEAHLADFFDGVTIPRCAFLACEPREVTSDYDIMEDTHTYSMPLHQFKEIEMEPEDFVVLMVSYIKIARKIKTYVIAGNQYMPAVAHHVEANETRCLGKNTTGKHGGYCPWVDRCAYAQAKLFQKQSISFQDLWDTV